jgi:DNA invertase Pin-like site-specific DNA recombinase
MDNQTELNNALDFIRGGDVFMDTSLDRCTKNNLNFYRILEILKTKEVELKATSQEFDTTTSIGRFMMGMLSVMSEFELDLRTERQAEGIKSAIAHGVKFEAKRKMTKLQVVESIEL